MTLVKTINSHNTYLHIVLYPITSSMECEDLWSLPFFKDWLHPYLFKIDKQLLCDVWCGNQCCMTTKDWPLDLIYRSSHLYWKQWSICFVFVWSFKLILDSGGCYHEGILQESLWWNTHRSQKWGDKNKHRGGADIFTALDPCPNCQQVIELKLYL